jgi:hypothetical protein
MHTYIILTILLSFPGTVLSAGLQEILNIARVIADIYQELPSSCIFIMNSDAQMQGENSCDFILQELLKICGDMKSLMLCKMNA